MSENRDFVLARLATSRALLAQSVQMIDDAVILFVAPDGDKDGSERRSYIDDIDENIGEAARACQAAQTMLEEVDMSEAEPDLPEGDGYDDEEEEAA